MSVVCVTTEMAPWALVQQPDPYCDPLEALFSDTWLRFALWHGVHARVYRPRSHYRGLRTHDEGELGQCGSQQSMKCYATS